MRRPRSRQEVALELPAQDESFSDTATQEQRYDEPTQQARRSALATLRRSDLEKRARRYDRMGNLYRLKKYRPPACENLESRAYSRPAGQPH